MAEGLRRLQLRPLHTVIVLDRQTIHQAPNELGQGVLDSLALEMNAWSRLDNEQA